MNVVDFTDALWRKSRYSGSGENCVEVARVRTVRGIRDSKDPGGGVLALSRQQWTALVRAIEGTDRDVATAEPGAAGPPKGLSGTGSVRQDDVGSLGRL